MPKLDETTAELAVVLGRCKPAVPPATPCHMAQSIAAIGRRMVKRNVARCNVQDYDMARAARLDAQDMRMVEDLLRPYREPANAPAFYASVLAKEAPRIFTVEENTNGVTPAFTVYFGQREFRF
mgnify:CR=1 FL=1